MQRQRRAWSAFACDGASWGLFVEWGQYYNSQRPTPNAQLPTPNSQFPTTSNSQLALASRVTVGSALLNVGSWEWLEVGSWALGVCPGLMSLRDRHLQLRRLGSNVLPSNAGLA